MVLLHCHKLCLACSVGVDDETEQLNNYQVHSVSTKYHVYIRA